jgi:hypothetical protein
MDKSYLDKVEQEDENLLTQSDQLRNSLIKENDVLLRLVCMERDGGLCVVCGTNHTLQVSHIYPKGLYPELRWNIENVEMRCVGCHLYRKGSPHMDPAGFADYVEYTMDKGRRDRLHRLSIQPQGGSKGTLWFTEQNEVLRHLYLLAFGSPYKERRDIVMKAKKKVRTWRKGRL